MREIVLEIEVTGFEPGKNSRIIEIAALELVNGQETGRHFNSFINPQIEIDNAMCNFLNTSNKFLKNKPDFNEIAQELADFIKDSNIIMFCSRFDLPFIEYEFRNSGHDIKLNYVIDVYEVAKQHYPKKVISLHGLCKELKIKFPQIKHHTVLKDAKLIAMLYKYLQDKTKSKEKPMTINELKTIHDKFSDFARRANVVLQKSGVEPFFYNSKPITGCLNNPDILFMGINPGLGRDDFGRIAEEADFVQSECKYIEENEGKLPLATNVVDCTSSALKTTSCGTLCIF